jgi:hypothetical protein
LKEEILSYLPPSPQDVTSVLTHNKYLIYALLNETEKSAVRVL